MSRHRRQDDVATNLQIFSRSRKQPKAGDVFAMQLPDDRYVFGRVISTEAHAAPAMPGGVLISIDRTRSEAKEVPSVEEMRTDRLLVSPIMTNRLPWTRGYFEPLANIPLADDDVLAQHRFRRWDGCYDDENLSELSRSVEPVGDYGLHSFRTIDDEVSDALGSRALRTDVSRRRGGLDAVAGDESVDDVGDGVAVLVEDEMVDGALNPSGSRTTTPRERVMRSSRSGRSGGRRCRPLR